jgi:hypothetical protein
MTPGRPLCAIALAVALAVTGPLVTRWER